MGARASGMTNRRRFPPSWTAEETDACFIVRDANGFAVAYANFEDEPGRKARTSHRVPENTPRNKLRLVTANERS